MRNVLRGILMGITDLIPGISGGTMAMVLGIYHDLVASINGIFSKQWRIHLLFLAPLLLGIGVAIIMFSRLIEWLITFHSQPLFFFFNGLIVGIIPFLLRTANYKKTFRGIHYTLLGFSAILLASTSFIREDSMQSIWTGLTLFDYLYLFFAGGLASSAMILPGISGSLLFLLMGVYPTVINALSTVNITVIFTIGFGILIGLIITSRLIRFLFSEYSILTYAVMTGLVIGSLFVTFPGFPANVSYALFCFLMFLSGLVLAILLGRFEHRSINRSQSQS